MTTLVEGLGPDALALAHVLAAEGEPVRIAGPGEIAEPDRAEAGALRELGALIHEHADLDADPGPADVAYLDVWTPETAARVQRLRAQGTRVTSLGDVLLERWQGPTIGITGTAGKTSTTALTATILRCSGTDVAFSRGARADNLWPTGDLLAPLVAGTTAGRTLLLELTSSHLAFMARSPHIAAVVSFWPDHLELHGGLDRYRRAKETIVRHQRPGDVVVVNADDAAAAFATLSPASVHEFSLRRPVERGAFLDPARGLVLVAEGRETDLGPLHALAAHPLNVVAAAAVSAAAGAAKAAIEPGVRAAPPTRWRAERVGALGGIPVIDDGMAATPAKAVALLARQPAGSVVLVVGGMLDAGGGPVHSFPEEVEALERACVEIARCARAVVAFGEAGPRLAELLRPRGVRVELEHDLAAAVERAAALAPGADAVIFSPLFPVSQPERELFASMIRGHT